jgi:DNA-binding NarL/FixJ family response regulator
MPPMATDELRIIVVHDHDLFRAGMVELLDDFSGFTVVGQGSTGPDAIRLAHELHPDIALLDVEMPEPGISAVLRQVLAASTRTGVVVVTTHQDPELIVELIHSGVAAYLHKSADRIELAAAIRRAARHDDSVLLSVSRRTLSRLVLAPSTESRLSTRELEVLRLLAEAKSNRDISRLLNISDGTVKRHLTNMYAKLGATSRLDAVRRGRASGALRSDSISYDSNSYDSNRTLRLGQ